MKPVHGWLLLEPKKIEAGGLALPDGMQEDVLRHDGYRVLAVADDVTDIKVGDLIIQEGPAAKFEYERKAYFGCRAEAVCFIVERKEV